MPASYQQTHVSQSWGVMEAGQNITQPSLQHSLIPKPDFKTPSAASGWSPCREQRCHHDSLKATGRTMCDMAGREWRCVLVTAVMIFRGKTLEFGPERTWRAPQNDVTVQVCLLELKHSAENRQQFSMYLKKETETDTQRQRHAGVETQRDRDRDTEGDRAGTKGLRHVVAKRPRCCRKEPALLQPRMNICIMLETWILMKNPPHWGLSFRCIHGLQFWIHEQKIGDAKKTGSIRNLQKPQKLHHR